MLNNLNERLRVKVSRGLLISSFIIYIVILIWAIIFKFMLEDLFLSLYNHLDKPVSSNIHYLFTGAFISSELGGANFSINVIVNILFFLPLGMYLPLLFKKYNILRDIAIGYLLSLSFELIQLFTRIGSPDLFDILLNVGGLILGSVIFYLVKPRTSDLIINYIQLFIIITCLPIMLYAIVTIPMNAYVLEPIFNFKLNPYIWS